jgi:hypothetical protein
MFQISDWPDIQYIPKRKLCPHWVCFFVYTFAAAGCFAPASEKYGRLKPSPLGRWSECTDVTMCSFVARSLTAERSIHVEQFLFAGQETSMAER